MPKVSICIPAYKPDYFDLALRSALAQSFSDTEILVSDDCPTEAIAEICNRYGDQVIYSRNPHPSESNNIKRLVALASGEYIKFLFDDDILYPFCIEYLVDLLEATAIQGTKLAFSPRHFIDGHNKFMQTANLFNIGDSGILIPGHEYIRLTAINHINLVGEFSTTLFRRQDCFDETGAFRLFRTETDCFDGVLDLSAWLELAKVGAFVGHPQVLSGFRVHGNSTSNPALNSRFIFSVTYYETILNYAQARGILVGADLLLACQNLIKLYAQWVRSFPALHDRITHIGALARNA